jgi:spore germination cell wall hydrolase CwlJ-like protein
MKYIFALIAIWYFYSVGLDITEQQNMLKTQIQSIDTKLTQQIFQQNKIIILLEKVLAKPVKPPREKYKDLDEEDKQQVKCIAANMFFESSTEPLLGKLAVAKVTQNRVDSSKYPTNYCAVVKQKKNGVCQFSWYCDDNKRAKYNNESYTKQERVKYDVLLELATLIYTSGDFIVDMSSFENTLYYHNTTVNPSWSKQFVLVDKIGNHIFYKEEI